MVTYGADEVSALVLDIGTSSVRAGFAGDDSPKVIIPTSYGYHLQKESEKSEDASMDTGQDSGSEKPEQSKSPAQRPKAKLYIGHDGPSLFRQGMEVANPLQGGLINDFSAISPIISHVYSKGLYCNPIEHPILMTEPAWNTPANRERMAEIMFEEFNVPAFYIANTGVLNAFAAGKGTALVLDIGQSVASVTPVVDGFVLRKGLTQSALPQLIHAHAKHVLTGGNQQRAEMMLLPHQLIASKTPVAAGKPPQFQRRGDRIPGVTTTWREWYEAREVDEWIMSVASVIDQGWNEQLVASRPHRHYEFPTGYNMTFGPERFAVGEQFFNHSQQIVASNPNLPKTLSGLITQSLAACEPDLRTMLLGNVVLCGGGSLFPGLSDRLNGDMTRIFGHVKIHAPGNPTERRYGGWLGGSVLASLGTFHQLWISKEEWQEHGKAIVGQRCK